MDKRIKVVIIGLGNMGQNHLNSCLNLNNCKLEAICDIDKNKVEALGKKHNIKYFYDYISLFNWGNFDSIIISTPHYDHTTIAIKSFELGFNVLTEKPVGVHINDINKMIKSYETNKIKYPKLQFAAMFQQRTLSHWLKIKDLLDSNELGKIVRTTWIITDWFRTQYYFDHGDWRATWKGEGGGVLLNQSPHQLDLYQWFVGVPDEITGFVSLGKYHDIEVEDEVTGYFKYKNGMVGHFITSTGEYPGSNRLEIVGENGKIIYENDKLTFFRNRTSMLDKIKNGSSHFDGCENWKIDIPFVTNNSSPHKVVIDNFADAVLNGSKLIANGCEGVNSVMISNSIMLSHFKDKKVDLPINGDEFELILNKKINESNFIKNKRVENSGTVDMNKSF